MNLRLILEYASRYFDELITFFLSNDRERKIVVHRFIRLRGSAKTAA